MPYWEFRTEGFRDPPKVKDRDLDGLEGAALAQAVREHLLSCGFLCGDVWDYEDDPMVGWNFYAESPEGLYLCAFLLWPPNGEAPEAARVMEAHAFVNKRRSFVDWLLGRNREAPGEAVPLAVLAFLRTHPAVEDLREG